MAENEPFLTRWSRLKQKTQTEEAREPPAEARKGSDAEQSGAARTAAEQPEPEEPFDLASLPKIEELTAETDIRKFLDVRVPAELRNAALRRAWTLDPAIRDFIEIAENQYDWNAPDGVPGFGPLNVVGGTIQSVLAQTTELRPRSEPEARLEPAHEAPGERSAGGGQGPSAPSSTAAPALDEGTASHANVTPRQDRSDEPVAEEGDASPAGGRRSRHGGALPV